MQIKKLSKEEVLFKDKKYKKKLKIKKGFYFETSFNIPIIKKPSIINHASAVPRIVMLINGSNIMIPMMIKIQAIILSIL